MGDLPIKNYRLYRQCDGDCLVPFKRGGVQLKITSLSPTPEAETEHPGQITLNVLGGVTEDRYKGSYDLGKYEDVQYTGNYEFAFKLPVNSVGEMRMCRVVQFSGSQSLQYLLHHIHRYWGCPTGERRICYSVL